MNFFSRINFFSQRRFCWLLLLIFALSWEIIALFFQHVMMLRPCVMCIYERVVLFGIIGAAMLGFISPRNVMIRWFALAIWTGNVIFGFKVAIQHLNYQLDSPFFRTCDTSVDFPSWIPLNRWLPWIFEAYGDCSEVLKYLGLSTPEWSVIIFVANLFLITLTVVAQFFSSGN
ncbi:disulfide bond protein [Candidatus Photodesmus blepharus]|uniref:Disulfide bond formation protein B n=1 Tax=Candidatus Photodesmus blepharonis TaxID=1179155 RepID=A0A084CP85_9GAMM|nr:disulfide bond formation protein DsbB [Candidatus Photodesmus blepharus]KEY91614.1 disulfide bond protein [Candidatus Photodesmus blepharus]